MTNLPIVHVVPYYPPHLGGMERVVSTLAAELAKTNPVEVLTTDCGGKGAPRLERRGGLTIRRLRSFEIANLPMAPAMLFQCLRVSPRSIVHVHVAQALIPEIVWISRRLRGGNFIAHFHLDVAPSGRLGFIFTWYKRKILGHTLRAAAKVVVFSADQASIVEKSYQVSANKIAVIPNGIGPEFTPGSGSDTPRGRPLRVLYVGRLSKQKVLPRLVHAVAAMGQPVEALLVGEGDERPVIEDLVRRYGLENVSLPGRRQDDELVATYQWADAFVLPSDREGMPLAALEAMASGLPVIATDVVGNRELLNGIGLLVEPDPGALAAALDRVAEDEILRTDLAKRSLAASANYTIGRLAERLSKLYVEANSSASPHDCR